MPEQEWMTVEETAALLSVPIEAVRAAIANGTLPALNVAGHIRLSRQALVAASAPLPVVPFPSPRLPRADAEEQPISGGRVLQPAGFRWIEQLAEAKPFTHGWPKTGGGTSDEEYFRAWKGVVALHGRQLTVNIGEAIRDGRGRLVIWLGPSVICEFVGTLSGDWASLIRLWGPAGKKKVLALGEIIPPLYMGVRIEPYQEATGRTGKGIPKGLAVVVARDDLESAVYHTAARWLSWQHLPLEPAV
jgi:excisionase family DNA binding protein